jgi:AMP-polyphosphate phosphotransferase
MAKKLRLKDFDDHPQASDEVYARDLADLQSQLQALQTAYIIQGLSAVVVFEGWDASGKGGAIKRLTEALDPRFCKVWPISAPTMREKGEHYLQRFWRRLPGNGELSVFDRSWYGRVLVERVEGFAPEAAWQRAYAEINAFEDMLVADGNRLVKLFMHVSEEEQARRFVERLVVPHKRWKTGADDYRNRARRADYIPAIHDMFDATNRKGLRWHVIAADDKKASRLAALRVIIAQLSKGVDLSEPKLDAGLLKIAKSALGPLLPKLNAS